MRIGLVRHYKVDLKRTMQGIPPAEFDVWFDAYNEAGILEVSTDLGGTAWDRCIASDLNRAIITAKDIFPGEVTIDPELREVRPYAAFKKAFRLPVMWWLVLARAGLMLGWKSQQESMKQFKMRLNRMIDKVESLGGNTLLVAHGAVLLFMGKELRKRGYKGPHYIRPKHGMLYVFEK